MDWLDLLAVQGDCTELKEKHTLEQDELFCCVIIISGLKERMSYVTFLLFEGPGLLINLPKN